MEDPLASWMWMSLTAPPPPPAPQAYHVVVNMDMLDKSVPEDDKVQLLVPSDVKVEVVGTNVDAGPAGRDKKPGGGDFVSWENKDRAVVDEGDEDIPLGNLDEAAVTFQNKDRPWIWRVHSSVRDMTPEAYEPKIVSIGPLHNGKEALKPMETIKGMYVKLLLGRSPKNALKSYFNVVRSCEARARKQYAEEIGMWSKAFTQMLVVDGCFMIEYFLREYFGDKQVHEDHLVGVGWGLHPLRRDLMLLENQIPFFVLEELFRASVIVPDRRSAGAPGDKYSVPAPSFMTVVFKFLRLDWFPENKRPEADQVHHLLHLQYWCLKVPDSTSLAGPLRVSPSILQYSLRKLLGLLAFVIYGLLYTMLIIIMREPVEFSSWKKRDPKMTIPCATELHKFGVEFKMKQFVENDSYLNITFSDGVLEMPHYVVGQTTDSQLRNFIAFERCHRIGNYFTEYAIFMDNIIDTVGDVSHLRKHGIIERTLGSDEQVVNIFNLLLEGTHISHLQHTRVSKLFNDVNAYCDFPVNRWRATLRSSHLRSPWATISLFAAIVAISTSIAQLVYAIRRPAQR